MLDQNLDRYIMVQSRGWGQVLDLGVLLSSVWGPGALFKFLLQKGLMNQLVTNLGTISVTKRQYWLLGLTEEDS